MTQPLIPTMTAFVRVTGRRGDKFVEFQYSLGDADLSVELIMPPAAFDEFCRRQGAVVLPASLAAGDGDNRPGLYRPPPG